MKRSQLKRGTKGLSRGKGFSSKPRPLKARSPQKKKHDELYRQSKEEYRDALRETQGLSQGAVPLCERCLRREGSDLHHRAGRQGCLLWAKEYFSWLCSGCHREVHHDNPKQAALDGWLVTLSKKEMDRIKLKEELRLYE